MFVMNYFTKVALLVRNKEKGKINVQNGYDVHVIDANRSMTTKKSVINIGKK